jgi:DNA-binding FadR family transcriptional regulator
MLRPAAQDEASLHDRLLEEWGSDIAAGRIGAGERLPQPSAELGVPSRTVTREVTRVLESKGMVNVRRKTGGDRHSISPVESL